MEKEDGTRHIPGFSKRFIKALKLKGYEEKSLSELGTIFGVTKTTVHYWKQRDNTPGILAADTIAMKLGVSFEWLLTGRGTPHELMNRDPEDVLVIQLYKNLTPEGREKALQYLFSDCQEYEIVRRTKKQNQIMLELIKTSID